MKKRLYGIIDKVKFKDEKTFTTEPILCNQYLTAIIGGKSTGKSILLKNMVKTADNAEFKKRNESVG